MEIDNDGSVEDADLTADVLQCDVDTADCDSNPTNGCETDLRNDSAQRGACNTACGVGEQCLEGACASECGAGLLFCVGACVDPMSDSTYCGSTDCLDGEACSGGALCNGAGVCEAGCTGTASNCDGVCVDLPSNASNCGTCGSSCGAGEVCDAGVCACAANLERCGSECVDLTSNPSHCGAFAPTPAPMGFATRAVVRVSSSARTAVSIPAPAESSVVPSTARTGRFATAPMSAPTVRARLFDSMLVRSKDHQ